MKNYTDEQVAKIIATQERQIEMINQLEGAIKGIKEVTHNSMFDKELRGELNNILTKIEKEQRELKDTNTMFALLRSI